MRTTKWRLLAALLALTLVAAACGDDDDDAEPAETSAAADDTETTEAETTDTETTEAETTEAMSEDEMSEDGDDAAAGTIVDVAAANDDFSTLVAAVQAADLVETLSGEGPFTVFAPTNAAFEAALADLDMTADELLADTDLLTSVLTYHVIADEVPSTTVVTLDGQSVGTVNGAEVTIGVDGDAVTVNDANVTAVHIEASNGIIHVIDAVLLPPS